ncbi:hypothetical protein Taro_034749 [Colocasia esculenta]|uniref:Uncharacterized protein n=1 Tax=Colocasia esculenta TaxID=4460 RepID=A0A843VYK3_COLES|nr:hypothetical protein [Colocasia esculenta]
MYQDKVQKIKKSRYLSTATKALVDSYTQDRKTHLKTGVPVDSTRVACRQPLIGNCFPNSLSSVCQHLSTGAPSAVDRQRRPSDSENTLKDMYQDKVQKIKKSMKSRYLSTATKAPVDSYTKDRKTHLRTEVPVNSTRVTYRQPLIGNCFLNSLSSVCQLLSTGAPSAVDRRRRPSDSKSFYVAIHGGSNYHVSPYVDTTI